MDIVKKCRVTIDFTCWEPLEKQVQAEIDRVTRFIRGEVTHAGNVRVSAVEVLSEKKS